MSAPTEAHLDLALQIAEAISRSGNVAAAQLIADSEAAAVEQANAHVESLLSAAKNAIPASEHPAEPTVQNWAWQIRNLGDDRRLVYADRDKLRAEVKESKARERAAIASWDEERQRALREGGQVVELRAEVAWWKNWHEENEKLEDGIAVKVQATIDQLRAEVERLKRTQPLSAYSRNPDDPVVGDVYSMEQSNARLLESARDELVNCAKRAERAEADAAAYLKRAESFSKLADEAEAELAAERARMADLVADLNDACITLESAENDCDDYAMQNTAVKLMAVRNVLLQHIPNAAMKEGA